MADEMSELKENAEHGEHGMAPVTITMAIIAVVVAAISLLGHRADTEALLAQTHSTDQWAYYQAKDTRLHAYETFIDQLSLTPGQADAEKMKAKYDAQVEKYTEQEKEIEDSAKEAEADVTKNLRRADRYDLGEVMLEAALVICSITLLTKNRVFWGIGLLLGIAGIALGVVGLTIH